MNILFLSNVVTPYQVDLLRAINDDKDVNIYGYFLFSKELNRDWNLELPKFITIADFNYKPLNYIRLYKFIKTNQIDKIIIGGYSLPTTFFTIFISKLKQIDLFFWLERPINKQEGIKKNLKEFYLQLVLRQSDKIFAIGTLATNIYSKYNTNVVNMPYSMNLDKFYNIKRDNKHDKVVFLFSGQYINRKNIINTIKAFKLIKNAEIELNIIGGGELEKEVLKLIENDVRINNIGFVQPKDLSNIYSQNNVFLMPSKHDGWALVINEAMASAMPIISTKKVGAVVEYIEHKENGYVCDIDIDSIKAGILYYINNKELIYIHGQNNRNIIKSSLADVNKSKTFLKEQLL